MLSKIVTVLKLNLNVVRISCANLGLVILPRVSVKASTLVRLKVDILTYPQLF